MNDTTTRGSCLGLKINEHGVVFGGEIFSALDSGTGYHANRAIGPSMTKAVHNLTFHNPLDPKGMYEVTCATKSIGKTSIKIESSLYSLDKRKGSRTLVAEALFIFVKVDENLRPTPISN